jgi:hypothetical protein
VKEKEVITVKQKKKKEDIISKNLLIGQKEREERISKPNCKLTERKKKR